MTATTLAVESATAADRSCAGASEAEVACFHDHGYCSVPQLLPRAEAEAYRAEALRYANAPESKKRGERPVFTQLVNVWREDEALKRLTFHPLLQATVRALARGRHMRLWHDHLLIKRPHNGVASEYHQDEPYWSVERETFTISAWIALGDAPVERGCMGFIPGTHRRRDLRSQNLQDAGDLLSLWPDLEWAERVVCPLRSGGCTFHQGFTAHRAGPNQTDQDRVAMSVIWVEADAKFNGKGHCVTDDLGLTVGQTLPDHRCPRV